MWGPPQPTGLISWRYFLPGQSEEIRFHRRLWWNSRPGLPRLLWLVWDSWQRLKWAVFFGPRTVFRILEVRGLNLEERASRTRQLMTLFHLSVLRGIPPRAVYQLGLFEKSREHAWSFIYDNELTAFHSVMNAGYPDSSGAIRLLADKLTTSQTLIDAGIDMVPIFGHLKQDDPEQLETLLQDNNRAFVKGQHGSSGRGAFTVWREDGELVGETFDGAALNSTADVKAALADLLKTSDALVQPSLINHSDLTEHSKDQRAISIRLVTALTDHGPEPLHAVIEIPSEPGERTGRPRYLILPISPETGVIGLLPDPDILPSALREHYDTLAPVVADGIIVPFWNYIVHQSRSAHLVVPPYWAIAWDWVVTPDGPKMLEGNTGWGMMSMQMLDGTSLQHALKFGRQ